MTKKKIVREKRDWTANWRLLPGLMCLALLAGCGGGGDGSDAATAQDATKQIAAAVPGSWTGRVPGSEVINGVTVPPEPSPTLNNATLAGVDANKNGVRDDVERVIATSFGGNQSKWLYVMQFSKSEQTLIVEASEASRNLYIKSALCSGLKSQEVDFITRKLLNTELRQFSYRKSLAGIVITGEECK